ncbi:MAG: DUF1343 domain-containing protein [Lachnospiraceae bacterium]|nr:DUF1343 domain-containing protein [Lachnospiraceae bacterium]
MKKKWITISLLIVLMLSGCNKTDAVSTGDKATSDKSTEAVSTGAISAGAVSEENREETRTDIEAESRTGETAISQFIDKKGEAIPKEAERVVLGDEQFDAYIPLLAGKRVALFSNHTGIVGDQTSISGAEKGEHADLIPFGYDGEGNEITYGQHILDALVEHGVNVTAIFSPEHGFRGTADAGESIADSVDAQTGVPILSLYHENTHYPSKENMDTFDILVVDMQDVGLRYYTYYISMYYLMDACAVHGKEMIILDRPNPNGSYVDGPILKEEYKSGVGQLPIPVVYGMTWGELAQMINGEGWLEAGKDACALTVIPCKHYSHSMKTDLICRPSPNIRDMRAVYLYASTCFFENTCVSVGRGTDQPFEIYGSPYLDGEEYTYTFVPQSIEGAKEPPFENETCFGRDLREIPLEEIWEDGINLDHLIGAYNTFHKEYPDGDFFRYPSRNSSLNASPNAGQGGVYWIDLLSGSDDLRKQIIAGKSAEEIKESWQDDIRTFKEQRKPYLLYEEP